MAQIVVTEIIFDSEPVLKGHNIKGQIYFEPEEATDTTVHIQIFKSAQLVHASTVDAKIPFDISDITTSVGIYEFVVDGIDPKKKTFSVVVERPVGDPGDAGFIPITSVGAIGAAPAPQTVAIVNTYEVGVTILTLAPEPYYDITLKLGFASNGTGGFTPQEYEAQRVTLSQTCASQPPATLRIASGSRSGNTTFGISLDPSSYPGWTFIVMAIPTMLGPGTPGVQSKTLH